MAEKDACYREVKASYKKFPSARASQAIAKCRKRKGKVRKGEKGKSLRRWAREKWVDTRTGEECGHDKDDRPEYCRPRIIRNKKKTPKTRVSKADKQKALFAKRAGKRAPTQKTPRR